MTSGARYHRVTTYPVISLSACLARPKSKICSQNQEEGPKGPRGESGPACRQVRGYTCCHPHQVPPQSTSAHQLLGHCPDDCPVLLPGCGWQVGRWGGSPEPRPQHTPSAHSPRSPPDCRASGPVGRAEDRWLRGPSAGGTRAGAPAASGKGGGAWAPRLPSPGAKCSPHKTPRAPSQARSGRSQELRPPNAHTAKGSSRHHQDSPCG